MLLQWSLEMEERILLINFNSLLIPAIIKEVKMEDDQWIIQEVPNQETKAWTLVQERSLRETTNRYLMQRVLKLTLPKHMASPKRIKKTIGPEMLQKIDSSDYTYLIKNRRM